MFEIKVKTEDTKKVSDIFEMINLEFTCEVSDGNTIFRTLCSPNEQKFIIYYLNEWEITYG